MDFIPLYIIIGGLITVAIYRIVLAIKCRRTCKKLDSLGELKGKKYSEVVNGIGQPDSKLPVSAGSFCQWLRYGYHLALTFDKDGVCKSVDSLIRH